MENGVSYEEAFQGEKIGDTWNRLLDEGTPESAIEFGVTSHYNQYQGFEVIDVCEELRAPDGSGGFNRGNAFKYLARAGWKSPEKHVEDLEKAKNYIQREIDRVKENVASDEFTNNIAVMTAGQVSSLDNPMIKRCPECSLQLEAIYQRDTTYFCPRDHGWMRFPEGATTGVWITNESKNRERVYPMTDNYDRG